MVDGVAEVLTEKQTVDRLGHYRILNNPGTQDTLGNLGEVAIDSILNEGLLQEIPIISTITGIARTAVRVRDQLFLRKLVSCLYCIESVPSSTRMKVIREISESASARMSIGEKLLYIIDRCHDHYSATYVGNIFRALLEGKIDYSEFIRMAFCIEKVIVEDFEEFLSREWKNVPSWEATHLLGSGLVWIDEAEISIRDQDDPDKGWERYIVENGDQTVSESEIGSKLKEILRHYSKGTESR